MKITCISASNIRYAGDNSTSLKACRIIEKIVEAEPGNKPVRTDIIRIADVSLVPCTGCGNCYNSGRCIAEDGFNQIYSRIADSDAVFIVSPHYAPIPAKLAALLEKMEQITFLRWFYDNGYRPEVYGIPVGIIAHGGGKDEFVLRSYKHMVLDTIANALGTIMMEVVGLDDEWPTGVVFPVDEVREDRDNIFPVQTYDWADVQNRITPLVRNVIAKVRE